MKAEELLLLGVFMLSAHVARAHPSTNAEVTKRRGSHYR